MMKYLIKICMVIGLMGCKSVTYNGEVHLQDKTYTNLIINGHATMRKVIVDEVATFSSSIEAYNSQFNIINSVASVECHGCIVKDLSAATLVAKQKSEIGNAQIKNNITLEDSSIDNVTFSGTEGVFRNSKIKSIRNTGFLHKRVVVLIDSEVSGDVSFESDDECKVLLKGNSKVLGATKNAKVE